MDVQALTINGFWWYAAERDLAGRIVRAQNDGLAAWVAAHPDRFVAMASVALQHPEQAATQLEDGVTRLGFRGASIGGHVNGEDLSLPKYDPFWAKAAALDVPVVMHPNGAENIIKEGALRGRGELGNIVGVGQVMYGTDVPFNWPVTVDLVLEAPFLTNDDKAAILGGNAARLLRLRLERRLSP